jgi:hypothetical protein
MTTPGRLSPLPARSSALGRPPLQPLSHSLPPSQPIPLQEARSQIPPNAPVLSIQVESPTEYPSHSRLLPSNDAPRLPWTLSPESSEDLLRPSRPLTPETPAFDIIDAYDYVKRVTLDQLQQEQQQQQVFTPESVAPPFTYTHALKEISIAEDGEDESSYQQPAHTEEISLPLSHTQPPSEGGLFRDSHDIELPSPIDGPPPPLPPLEGLPGPPRVEAQLATRLPDIVRAPSSVQSPEAKSNSLYLENNTGTPSPLASEFNIVTPTVPPVPPPPPPPIGLTIVGRANASHRRYTPLSIPGEILSPGEEFSPVTTVGLARTPRTANFEVLLWGMHEDKVEQPESATSVDSNELFPPNVGVPEEARGLQRLETFNVSSSDSAAVRRVMMEVKGKRPTQGLVGRELDVMRVHEGRFASQGREELDTSADPHDEGPEDYDEDDGGEFEMVAAQLEPRSGLDSESNGDVQSGIVRTAGEVSLSSALAPLPSRRTPSSPHNGREDDGWYPRLPTDGVVGVVPKNKGKPKLKLVSIPVPEVKETNQGRGITHQGLGKQVKNRSPPVRPPRPPSLGFDLRALGAMSGGEEEQNERFKQLEDRRGQQERSGVPGSQYRKADEPGNQSASAAKPDKGSLPKRIPTAPSFFSPLTITLDTVSLSDMLGASAAPAASQPWAQVDHALVVSPKEAKKEPPGSGLHPASDGSDILGLEEALSRKPAPIKPRGEPATSLDAGQGEFGKRDLGRNAATVQDAKRGFDSSSSGQPHPITLPTPNKPAFGPTTFMFPDPPLYNPTQSVPPPLQISTKSVFEAPIPVPTDTIPPFNNVVPRPPASMPLEMLPILPMSSPPRPKHDPPTVRNPDFVRPLPAPPAPKYRAPSPPYKDLHKGISVPPRGPWASSPSDLASLEPVAGESHPSIAPPDSVPQRQVKSRMRGSSLPDNQIGPSSPPGQPSGVVAPPLNGDAQPSPRNGADMGQTREGMARSYYENSSSETWRFPPVSGKKKKPLFAGVVGALLKTTKLNKRAKAAKRGLASIEERGSPRGTIEQGHAEQEYKQDAPTIAKSVLPLNLPTGQGNMSPPLVPQQSPPALYNFPSQSLPAQGPTNTLRGTQQIGEDGSVSREQRVQPAAPGVFASDDVRDQPVPYRQDELNAANQPPLRLRASEDTPSTNVSSSHRPVVTAPPPLIYFPSVPIATHVASISARLEAERDSATSGGDPIPSLNTASISHVISSLSNLNTHICEACAILTKAIVTSRIATGESGASLSAVETRRMSTKVEKDMRTRLCEFLTGGIFGRFSVALGSEEDQALREAHGDVFVRCGCFFSLSV